jgi:hypothetical protein
MATSRVQRPAQDGVRDDKVIRLERENAQLRHAVESHATVDQAIGVLIAVCHIPRTAGFEVLREVSQHTNIKLHIVAQSVIDWALGLPLPSPVDDELEAAVKRHRSGQGAQSQAETPDS